MAVLAFFIQLVHKPHFRTLILLFGPLGQVAIEIFSILLKNPIFEGFLLLYFHERNKLILSIKGTRVAAN